MRISIMSHPWMPYIADLDTKGTIYFSDQPYVATGNSVSAPWGSDQSQALSGTGSTDFWLEIDETGTVTLEKGTYASTTPDAGHQLIFLGQADHTSGNLDEWHQYFFQGIPAFTKWKYKQVEHDDVGASEYGFENPKHYERSLFDNDAANTNLFDGTFLVNNGTQTVTVQDGVVLTVV